MFKNNVHWNNMQFSRNISTSGSQFPRAEPSYQSWYSQMIENGLLSIAVVAGDKQRKNYIEKNISIFICLSTALLSIDDEVWPNKMASCSKVDIQISESFAVIVKTLQSFFKLELFTQYVLKKSKHC